jgi:hypothetical protein
LVYFLLSLKQQWESIDLNRALLMSEFLPNLIFAAGGNAFNVEIKKMPTIGIVLIFSSLAAIRKAGSNWAGSGER